MGRHRRRLGGGPGGVETLSVSTMLDLMMSVWARLTVCQQVYVWCRCGAVQEKMLLDPCQWATSELEMMAFCKAALP